MSDLFSALGPAMPIVIIKPDGTRGGVSGRITAKKAYVLGVDAPIAGGDILEQTLPSGATQIFDVIQAIAYAIPQPHLQVQIRPRTERRLSPPAAAGVSVMISHSVVDGAVQVGHGNHAVVTSAARYSASDDHHEMREEVLAALDQAIATHRLVIEGRDDVAAVRAGIDALLARIDQLAGDAQMSREAFRGVAELAATQVQEKLRPNLRAWLASHPTPIMQNVFASILFEAAKAAVGAG